MLSEIFKEKKTKNSIYCELPKVDMLLRNAFLPLGVNDINEKISNV
jgi:hypothetical protein